MKVSSYKTSGFTLIELLLVIVIIGILAGAVVAIINPARARARAGATVVRATTEKACMALHACSASTQTLANCNSWALIGSQDLTTTPVGANSTYTITNTDPVTITGTYAWNNGAAVNCTFTCNANIGSGAVSNMAQGGTCPF